MIVITAVCPKCGNEPEESVCEVCGYEGDKYGWAISVLHLPSHQLCGCPVGVVHTGDGSAPCGL